MPLDINPPGFRALGPGSVSSLLKVALDVAYVLMWVIAGVVLTGLLVSLFVPWDGYTVTMQEIPVTRPLLVLGLGSVAAYFGGFVLILHQLRKIFRTLTLGDPFQPENVRRLRLVGLILAVITGGGFIVQRLIAGMAPGAISPQGISDLLTPVFSVLVVFVLAEVFREGARLRRESELTI